MMMFLLYLLLGAIPSAGADTPSIALRQLVDLDLDFSISDTVSMLVDATTIPDSWSVQFGFGYSGPVVEFQVGLFDYASCASELVDPPLTLLTPAVTLSGDGFWLGMTLNATAIQSSSLWEFVDETQTSASIQFCARVDLYYESVLINFAKTQASIFVQTESGELSTFSTEQSVSTAVATKTSSNVELLYPVRIFHCGVTATEVEATTVSPGSVISFCVSLAQQGAYALVSGINSVTYRSAGIPEVGVAIQDGAPFNGLANLDCSFVGVCRVEFIAPVEYFIDNVPLQIQGDAVVSLAGGTVRRQLLQQDTDETAHSNFAFQITVASSPHSTNRDSPDPSLPSSDKGASSGSQTVLRSSFAVACLFLAFVIGSTDENHT